MAVAAELNSEDYCFHILLLRFFQVGVGDNNGKGIGP